jgi:hypothetical protein
MDLVAEYVEPVQPGYRMLQDGDIIKGDDEWNDGRQWRKACGGINRPFNSHIHVPHRRLVEPAPVESPDDWVIQDRVPARVVDPGEGYRLLADDEITLPTDERSYFGCESWDTLEHANAKYFIGATRKELLKTWSDIFIRRRIAPATRTVVLKEWICWDDDGPVITLWQDIDPATAGIDYNNFDNAVATGETRTVEIPVT